MRPFDQSQYVPGGEAIRARTQSEIDHGLRAFMLGAYNHMVLGLAISALVALGVNELAIAASPADAAARIGSVPLTAFGRLLYTTPSMWVVALAPLAFISVISFRMERMSPSTAQTGFLAFAALMSASLSVLLLRYSGASVVQVFFITAASFGGLSLWGYTTKRTLSGAGSFLIMGLIGLIAALMVNVIVASSALQFAVSIVGVLIFAGLTAYDTQKLKETYLVSGLDGDGAARASVFGAMMLYLDFINMFQFLLALFGGRNE